MLVPLFLSTFMHYNQREYIDNLLSYTLFVTTEIQTLVPLFLSTFLHYNGDVYVSTSILIYLHALQRRFKS